MMAKLLLEDEVRCPPPMRDFLWRCLMRQVQREEFSFLLGTPGYHALAYSPDGKILAVGGGLESDVLLFDAETGKKLAALKTEMEEIHKVLFSSDGKKLAVSMQEYPDAPVSTSAMQTDLQVWDIESRKKIVSRQPQLFHSGLLTSTDAGFFFHTFASESEYSRAHPDYAQEYVLLRDDHGQVIDRWYEWRTYNIQSQEEKVRYLSLGEGANVTERFYAHGDWLTIPCYSPGGGISVVV